GALWRPTLAVQIRGTESGKDLHRLPVQSFRELEHRLVPIRQFLRPPGIPARASRYGLREHVALDGRDVPHQIAESKFSLVVGPIQLVRRNAARDSHGALVN